MADARTEIKPGDTAQRSLHVTSETVLAYAELTGDYNPLHFDAGFTSRTRFGRLMAQGGITTGLLHALVAMDLPGPGSVFMSQSWSFPRPAYIGDTLTAVATVKSARSSRGIYGIEFVVRNQDDEEVLTGEATVYHAKPAPDA
ncbi:MAG TPA: MaoC family dehydratase [Dehalococcoidia bacterium]|nr:MaoC family dehydratase [Dehalococcoidia bacterium]